MAGRRQALEYVRFLVDRVPGYERASLVAFGTGIGVRETRRVYGDYRLTRDDVLAGRSFADAVGLCGAPIEDHHGGAGTVWQYLPDGAAVGIPYRSLVVRDAANVLVAGRCFSATHDAHASVRSMAQCMAMGQAAGTAAAMAVAGMSLDPRDVPVEASARAVSAAGWRDPRAPTRDDPAVVGRMTFVRTVLGDIDPSELGVTYAHEHVIIDGGRPVADGARLRPRRRGRDGTRGAPRRPRSGCGRSSTPCPATPAGTRQAGRAVAPDRRPHHRPDRSPPRPLLRTGALEPPCLGRGARRPVRRRHHRWHRRARLLGPGRPPDGVSAPACIKIAGSRWRTVRARPAGLRGGGRRAPADRRTDPDPLRGAAPARWSRSSCCSDLGVDPSHVALSHVDKVVDRGYHRELLGEPGRRRVRPVVPLEATRRTARSSSSTGWSRTGSPAGSCSGMDAARQGYYHAYGGTPGLTWLLDGFTRGARARPASTRTSGSAVRRQPGPRCSPSRRLDRMSR